MPRGLASALTCFLLSSSDAALWVAQQRRQTQSWAQQFLECSPGDGPALAIATFMCRVTQTFFLEAFYHLTGHEGACPSLQRLSDQAWRSWSGLLGQGTSTLVQQGIVCHSLSSYVGKEKRG